MTDFGDRMRDALPEKTLSRIEEIGRDASAMDLTAYVVGGCVRDILLGRPAGDIDVGVVGDAQALAVRLAENHPCKVKKSLRYNNATLTFDDGEKIDLISARGETYAQPGAWPVAEASGIEDDLARRDFTINTMAAHINPGNFGQFVDLYDGRKDLEAGLVRALHKDSFTDDPTRILRACRFAGRFGYAFEAKTAKWMQSYKYPAVLPAQLGKRIAIELMILFHEDDPVPALRHLAGQSVRRAISTHFLEGEYVFELLDKVQPTLRWYEENQPKSPAAAAWNVWTMTAFSPLHARELVNFCKRLDGVDVSSARELMAMRNVHRDLFRNRVEKDSQFAKRFSTLGVEALLVMTAQTPYPLIEKALRRYLLDVRHRKLRVRGADLQALGIEPGPEIGRILALVKDAVYDGEVESKAEQLALAKRFFTETELK